jgi:hypothetical protein
MEPKGFLIYSSRGIACALSNYGHKHYPSNNLDQNNSINGVSYYPHEGIAFFFRFELLILGGKEFFFGLSAKL